VSVLVLVMSVSSVLNFKMVACSVFVHRSVRNHCQEYLDFWIEAERYRTGLEGQLPTVVYGSGVEMQCSKCSSAMNGPVLLHCAPNSNIAVFGAAVSQFVEC